MMKATEFVRRWTGEVMVPRAHSEGEGLVGAPEEAVAGMEAGVREFLVAAGLPRSCAPFLSFDEVGKGLPRLWEVYGTGWSGAEKERVAGYRMIGSDGSGNPICVEGEGGKVVLLDHEVGFRPLEFMNSSVGQLAESLLIFSTTPMKECGEAIGRVDPPAVAEGAFWVSAIEMCAAQDEPVRVGKRRWWEFW